MCGQTINFFRNVGLYRNQRQFLRNTVRFGPLRVVQHTGQIIPQRLGHLLPSLPGQTGRSLCQPRNLVQLTVQNLSQRLTFGLSHGEEV